MIGTPSPWVVKHLPLIPDGGRVLDLACGTGLHAIYAAQQGYQVDAIDRDVQAISGLLDMDNINVYICDLEATQWRPSKQNYDGIVVSRYLYRPLLRTLFETLKPGGVLIYETFMVGNERYGKPSNPDFLLLPDELLNFYTPLLSINAFEQGEVQTPLPAVMQRICATKNPR
jgi:SAM-dependent methyltransferase